MRRFIAFITLLVIIPAVSCKCPLPAANAARPAVSTGMLDTRNPETLPQPLKDLQAEWLTAQLEWADETLLNNPPNSVGSFAVRKTVLGAIDDALHLVDSPNLQPVADFYLKRIDRALDEIAAAKVEPGQARVWKLYNHGFIIKTARHIWAHDVYGGTGKTRLDKAQLGRIAGLVETAFVSHYHNDHADPEFVAAMVNLGKPVQVPPKLWEDREFFSSLTVVEPGAEGNTAGISYHAFPGHQSPGIINNCYLIGSSGIYTLQTGDQDTMEDYTIWLDGFGKKYEVDILLPNCWTPDIVRMIGEVDPELVLTGHENELGHVVYKRESYGKSYRHLEGLAYPYCIMTWGESYLYEK